MRYAIVVAAGNSTRYGKDKLEENLLGGTVLSHSTEVFLPIADKVVVVGRHVAGTAFAEGGQTRAQSVYNGLQSIPDDGVVAIHDGARPFVTRSFAEKLFSEAERYGSAIPRLPLTDALYRDGKQPVAANREEFFCVQTPQVFDTVRLKAAYDAAAKRGLSGFNDDGSVFAANGNPLHFVEGLRSNVKLTYADDVPRFRVGNGFDVHPFTQGNGVVLGGVTIPFGKKLQGHSDADVLCHAVCDAVLSASGNKDIGCQFPDDDPAYEGISSVVLLERCVRLAQESGYEVVNVSATVICQEPKISPYADEMACRIAQVCALPPRCVSISATTTERLGALGNGDGIAAEATALLRRA